MTHLPGMDDHARLGLAVLVGATEVLIEPFGESAITLGFARNEHQDVSAVVRDVARRLDQKAAYGVVEIQPALDSVLVQYDPVQVTFADVVGFIRESALSAPDSTVSDRQLSVPVCFAPQYGLDLVAVGAQTGLGPTRVVAHFLENEYVVRSIGFLPGYAYMGTISDRLRVPRRTTPRHRVLAGSVAIAGDMAAVYPATSPGGWNVLGRTPLEIFDARAEPPCLFEPGDRVSFVEIDDSTFRTMRSTADLRSRSAA